MILFAKAKSYTIANRHILLILYFPVYIIAFFALERCIPDSSGCWISYMPLDDRIPFLEIFVIPYVLWYPLLAATALILLLTQDAQGFKKYMLFIILGFSITLVFCALVPNAQELRALPLPRDNIFTRIVAGLYAADTPTNVFPSMHVIGSVACAAACLNSPKMKKLHIAWVILAVLISLSTVFIKQHSALDIFGALALCVPIWICLYPPRRGRERKNAVQKENIRGLFTKADSDDKTE